jgi:hypothetical protein
VLQHRKKEESRMSLLRQDYVRTVKVLSVCLAWMAMAVVALTQTVSTTTVQGTVYTANGAPGSGVLQLSWPAFTTASGQTVAAGKNATNIGADGFVSVNLAPNLGSSPAGLYYTAIYHLSDGTTSTEFCRNAALALEESAASVSALWTGNYTCTREDLDADVWPGDALE